MNSKRAMQRLGSLFIFAMLLAASPWLTGCQNFFVCDKASCTSNTSGTGSASGNYAYVAGSTTGTQYVSGYDLSTGSPVALTGAPYQLSYVPAAMTVVPGQKLMFIASSSSPSYGIYAYSIGSTGELTILNNGTAVANGTAAAMDVTPDGKYLFVLNSGLTSTTVDEYSIASSTGVLTSAGTQPSSQIGGNAAAIKVAPSANFVVISLGTAGDEVFPLSNDLFTGTPQALTFTTTNVGDFAVTVDSKNNVYFARTGLVAVYSATASGVLTPVTNSSSGSATGSGDHSIVLASSDGYLYTGNSVSTTLSGFTNTSGTLGAISSSPYSAPSSVASIGVDKSSKYIAAAGYGSGALVEYAIGTGGTLSASSTTASTASNVVPYLALTR